VVTSALLLVFYSRVELVLLNSTGGTGPGRRIGVKTFGYMSTFRKPVAEVFDFIP
jgi:hypothetical protein